MKNTQILAATVGRPSLNASAPGLAGTNPAPEKTPEPPLPTDDFQPKGEKGRASASKIALGLLGAAGGILALTGCAGSSPPPASQCASTSWSTSTAEGQFKVEVLPEEMGSIDLIRQTETNSDGEAETEEVDLSPVGVYLGDGIFFDTNGNLRLVPARAFGLQLTEPGASRVTLERDGFNNDLDIKRNGTRVEVDGQGFGRLNSIIVTEGDESASINPHGFGNWDEIKLKQNGNKIVIDPHGFGAWDQITIKRDGNRTVIEQPGWLNGITLTHTENSIKVDPHGPFNNTTTHFCGEDVTIDGPKFRDNIEIHRDGNKVEVKRKGPFNDTDIDLKAGGGAHFSIDGPFNDLTVKQKS